MDEISLLIERHKREMAVLDEELRRETKRRERKFKELEQLIEEARRLNEEECRRELRAAGSDA
mgnify:CR=1 FL=1